MLILDNVGEGLRAATRLRGRMVPIVLLVVALLVISTRCSSSPQPWRHTVTPTLR